MNNAFCKLALVAALTCMHGVGHAAFGDLSPGSGTVGAGNLRGGWASASDPASFYRDQTFHITWQGSTVAPSERFTDIVGTVGSVWRSASGLSPYAFTAIELYSLGTGSLLDSYSFVPGSDQVEFTFGRLLEGGYSIRFIGQSVTPPDGWWPVNEWQYSFSAVASAVASPAPEPSQLAMSALGLAAVVAWARRRKRALRTETGTGT